MIFLNILLFLVIATLNWLLTCGIIYLITLCFGWGFSLAIATGIWLILVLIGKRIQYFF